MKYEAIVIGTSAGGIDALKKIFSSMKESLDIPIIISFHLADVYARDLPMVFDSSLRENVVIASGKEVIAAGKIYFAPPLYLIKSDGETITLSLAEKTDGRMSPINLLFETASQCYGNGLLGIILTGANCDGAKGLKRIKLMGGKTIVQEPAEAYASAMPICALETVENPEVMNLEEIGDFIEGLNEEW